MNKEIEIPFNEWSKERLKAGKKTATSRSKKYGDIDDYFIVDGTTYVIKSVTKESLIDVAEYCYSEEGVDSPREFIKLWVSIHPKKGFRPEQVVFFHTFKRI